MQTIAEWLARSLHDSAVGGSFPGRVNNKKFNKIVIYKLELHGWNIKYKICTKLKLYYMKLYKKLYKK